MEENCKLKEASRVKLLREYIFSLALAVLIAVVCTLFYAIPIVDCSTKDIVEITYSAGKTIEFDINFLLSSLSLSFISTVLCFLSFFFLNPSREKRIKEGILKNSIYYAILSLFGILAFVVIAIFASMLEISNPMSIFLASFLSSIYNYLIFKMYFEGRNLSNHLFWEIFRFAIVGLVAAVFDFLLCFVFQFYVFKGQDSWYVSGVSTLMGFTLGVVINYLLSTYMVYRNAKTSKSKSLKGIILFLLLALIGLFLGILIQYVLYDFLNLKCNITIFSYPVCFVVRTLIVMVYNYISRKIFIYR